MKLIKAACLLVAALAILAVPAVQAQSQRIISPTTVRDLSAPPFPPPHAV
jgi:hypothetical protein